MTKDRLRRATLDHLPASVARPAYDRTALKQGIVHLGLGAFFRAHGAAYTDSVLATGDTRWGIVGVSLVRPDQRDRLKPQDGLYTLVERDGDTPRARVVGSVLDVLVAPESPAAVIDRLAHPDTHVVSLTITEKGYCHNPATGHLDVAHPNIVHDLASPHAPKSAIGYLVAGLARRRTANLKPFTVLCCDNLPHNGRLVRGLVNEFARRFEPALADWIEAHGAFPSTMVDRIVPAATPADLDDALRLTGLHDAAPVSHEPFAQWVIEDQFVDGLRPAWEAHGAEIVSDVAPFENMKLRLLNGAHSALAYLGYLGGHETIGACVADPVYRRYVERLWRDEIVPATPAPPGVDLATYAGRLLDRFANPAIRHRTWQIAMDGSQKLPQRLLATARLRIDRDLPIDGLALAIAAWIRYVGGRDEHGAPIDVRDPLAGQFAKIIADAGPDPSRVATAILGVAAVFPPALSANIRFSSAVANAYDAIVAHGSRAAIAAHIG
ncbi:MAG TPA: mannitol dehydrogenase family protein [Hyphomicrobiaceae bacterium]|nr:mannitol dehydrogenase family protein [Hyphomicrobiaceae bacterium]